MAKEYWAGFDLGGTKMLAMVFDGRLRVVGRKRRKTKAKETEQSGIERIVETIESALMEAGISAGDLRGIGVGCPGPLDLEHGILLESANLGWANMPLKEMLEKALGCPAVIMNDVDGGVYGEYRMGVAKKARCVLGVFPGTGIGGGCVYEGRIHQGNNRSCMEIGHLRVQPDGALCGCGQRGCLETVASRLAISAAAASAAFRGETPNLLRKAGTDLSNIRSGVLAEAVAAGDKVLEGIIRNAAQWLGVGVGMAVNLLGPDLVVLGGGLVEAMPDLFRKETEASARSHVMPAFKNTFRVVIAGLGDDATATGSAAWAMETVAPDETKKRKG